MPCARAPLRWLARATCWHMRNTKGRQPSSVLFQRFRYITTQPPQDGNKDLSFAQQLDHMKLRLLPIEEGPWDIANVQALRKTLQSHLSLPNLSPRGPIPPGYHQVSFNSVPLESELCQDGAEKLHSPSDEWKFRVWAGGSMVFLNPSIQLSGPKKSEIVAVREEISGARLIGDLDDNRAKVMVTLKKTLFAPETEGIGRETAYNTFGNVIKGDHLIVEDKILYFMRDMPDTLSPAASSRILPFPSNPTYSQTMTPSPTLLFRFSALTTNAHAIHLDYDYTRRVYGFPKPLVQGQLTSILMLDVLGQALALQNAGESCSQVIRSFEYRNLLPLFVNEQITIACKKKRDLEPQDTKNNGTRYKPIAGVPWEKWDVWIQKGTGSEATLAVRGSALVSGRKNEPPGDELEDLNIRWDFV